MLDSREQSLSVNAPVAIFEPVVDDRFRIDPTSGTPAGLGDFQTTSCCGLSSVSASRSGSC